MSLDKLNTAEYSKFIHKSRYARWDEKKKRREEWEETIDRLVEFWSEEQPLFNEVKEVIREAITNTEIMPSMRSMMTAGKALKRDNVAGYNCSYVAVDNQRVFDETMYILMCFAPDTLIKTKLGDKKISELIFDDEVLTFNRELNEYEYIKPSSIHETPTKEREKIELEFDDGYIVKCTADHRFLTSNRGWVEAHDLTEDDDIQNYHEI